MKREIIPLKTDPESLIDPLSYTLRAWRFKQTWFGVTVPDTNTMSLDATASLIQTRFNSDNPVSISDKTRMNIMLTKIENKTFLQIVSI